MRQDGARQVAQLYLSERGGVTDRGESESARGISYYQQAAP